MPPAQHFALYGAVALQREYCPRCKQYALVRDGKLLCCDAPTEFDSVRTKRMSETHNARKRLTVEERREILLNQGYRCLYCERLFGSSVVRRGRLIQLRVNFDHVVPFSYSQDNFRHNFVAACQICNAIKSDLMFPTLDAARVHIRLHWEAKGIRDEPVRESRDAAIPDGAS